MDQLITEFVHTASSKETYLPKNINMSLGLNDNEVVRFAVSEQTLNHHTWQELADMSDYDSWNTQPQINRVILFKPYTSQNIDFAYENYYAEGSYFAVNLFQKEIADYHGANSFVGSFNVPDVFNSRAPEDPANTCYDPGWGGVTQNVPVHVGLIF